MTVLDATGLSTLWSKIKSNFGHKLTVGGIEVSETQTVPTIELHNGDAQSLGRIQLLADGGATVTENANGNLVFYAPEAGSVECDTALSTTSTNAVQNKVITTALAAKAPLASPVLTGTPKAPTAVVGTNTTQIATTAFVQNQINMARGMIWQFGNKARSATDTWNYTDSSWINWYGALNVLLYGDESGTYGWSSYFSKMTNSYGNSYGFQVIKAGTYRIEMRMTGAASTRFGSQIYHATDSAILAESSAYSNGAVTGDYCSAVVGLDVGDKVYFRFQPFGDFTRRSSGAMSNVTIEYLGD